MATKTRSKHQAGLYSSYKTQNKQAANRKRKLLKLQKEQPNNAQITEALKSIKYRRGTPKNPHWSHSAIQTVMLFKTFKKGSDKVIEKMSEKEMGKLKHRAHTSEGELFWVST